MDAIVVVWSVFQFPDHPVEKGVVLSMQELLILLTRTKTAAGWAYQAFFTTMHDDVLEFSPAARALAEKLGIQLPHKVRQERAVKLSLAFCGWAVRSAESIECANTLADEFAAAFGDAEDTSSL